CDRVGGPLLEHLAERNRDARRAGAPRRGEHTLRGHNHPPFPGGLVGRSFRADPRVATGEASLADLLVQPGHEETVRYTLCIRDEHWRECQEAVIEVIREGDLAITEVMPLPANGGAEWIEIRNYRSRPVDLQGFTLTRGTQTYAIEATLIVPPGGHVILAGANDPFIQPDHVYTGWSLGGAAGTVILGFEGMPVHAVSWSNAVEGIAMQLPGHAQIRGRATTLASELCAASTTYDGANLGTPGGASDCRIHGYLVDFFSDVPFIDIRDSGTSLPTLVADTAAAAIPGGIGFTMPFFSGTVTDLWANSNGLVGLSGTTNTTAANRNLTNSTTQTNGLIAAFWDD